jgi:2'-5' RNA ligase
MKLRLFVGITAPDEWKRVLTDWRRKTQPRFSHSFAKWTSEANLHLTLRFFGSVEETELPKLADELLKAAQASTKFSLIPDEFGCFPNPSRPRILWLGFRGQIDNLLQLESTLRQATAQFGQPPEDRPFHPHLTLARLKEPTHKDRNEIAELLSTHRHLDVRPWNVNTFELIRSEPKAEGSLYATLATFPLGPQAPRSGS